jgi:hypothetical protein
MYEWIIAAILVIILLFYTQRSNFLDMNEIQRPSGNTRAYTVPYFSNLKGAVVYDATLPKEYNYDMYYMQYGPPFNVDFPAPPAGLEFDYSYQPIMPMNWFDKTTYL